MISPFDDKVILKRPPNGVLEMHRKEHVLTLIHLASEDRLWAQHPTTGELSLATNLALPDQELLSTCTLNVAATTVFSLMEESPPRWVSDPLDAGRILVVPEQPGFVDEEEAFCTLLQYLTRDITQWVACTILRTLKVNKDHSFADLDVTPRTLLDWVAHRQEAFWQLHSTCTLAIPKSNSAELYLRHRWTG